VYAGVALMAALIKLSEAYFVWKLGGLVLCCICLSTWLYFFLAATALHFRYIWKMREAKHKQNVLNNNVVDVLAGELPTTMRLGGGKKVSWGLEKRSYVRVMEIDMGDWISRLHNIACHDLRLPGLF
jgi:hypothetical protein